ASDLTGPQHTFPPPWLPAASINGVEIIPIDNSADLYREGAFTRLAYGGGVMLSAIYSSIGQTLAAMLVARAKCGACGASGSRGTAHRGYARAKVSAQAEPADDRGRHRGRPAGAQAAQGATAIGRVIARLARRRGDRMM